MSRCFFLLVLFTLAELACGACGAGTDLKPDLVVSVDGSADFTSVAAAVASIPADNRERRIVFIKPGVYREKVRVDANDVTLCGADRATTRIEFPQGATEFRAHPDAVGQWDPESITGPAIRAVSPQNEQVVVTFTESVTVKGPPRLHWANGAQGDHVSGSGTTALVFAASARSASAVIDRVELNGGAIIATEASAGIRFASLKFP